MKGASEVASCPTFCHAAVLSQTYPSPLYHWGHTIPTTQVVVWLAAEKPGGVSWASEEQEDCAGREWGPAKVSGERL